MRHVGAYIALVVTCAIGCGSDQGGRADILPDPPLASVVQSVPQVRASGRLHVSPGAPGAQYLRCGTYAGERAWHPQLSPRHTYLAALTNTGTVRLIATETLDEVAELASSVGRVDAVAFSPDDAAIATFSHDADQLAVWRTRDGSLLYSEFLRDSNGDRVPYYYAPASVAFSADGAWVATSLATLTDIARGHTRYVARHPELPEMSAADVQAVRFVNRGRRLYLRGFRGSRQIKWPVHTFVQLDTGEETHLEASLPGYDALSRDGSTFALTTGDQVLIYDLGSATLSPERAEIQGRVIALSPDGARLYVRQGSELMAYDRATREVVAHFTLAPDRRIIDVAPEGWLVARGATDTAWLDPQTGAVEKAKPEVLTDLSLSDDGQLGAGAGPSSLVHVWREQDGTTLLRSPPITPPMPVLRGRPNVVSQAWYSRLEFVTSSEDGAVTVYKGSGLFAYDSTGKQLRWFRLSEGAAYPDLDSYAEITADGKVLLTVDGDPMSPGTSPYIPVWCR